MVSLGILALTVGALASTGYEATGVVGTIDAAVPDINRLGESLFTDYLYAFEIVSVLLVIAVVGAILMARQAAGPRDRRRGPGGAGRGDRRARGGGRGPRRLRLRRRGRGAARTSGAEGADGADDRAEAKDVSS